MSSVAAGIGTSEESDCLRGESRIGSLEAIASRRNVTVKVAAFVATAPSLKRNRLTRWAF